MSISSKRKIALANTLEIADKCSFEIKMGNLLMPHYPIPKSVRGRTWTHS